MKKHSHIVSSSKPLLLTVLLALCWFASVAPAEDGWPGWMGQNRDNRWTADNILTKFPEGGPKVLWRAPVAGGYAGPAAVGDRSSVQVNPTASKLMNSAGRQAVATRKTAHDSGIEPRTSATSIQMPAGKAAISAKKAMRAQFQNRGVQRSLDLEPSARSMRSAVRLFYHRVKIGCP